MKVKTRFQLSVASYRTACGGRQSVIGRLSPDEKGAALLVGAVIILAVVPDDR